LAVAIGFASFAKQFVHQSTTRLAVYDLREGSQRRLAAGGGVYATDALAFHPTRNLLAVAGGDHHEVALWDLDQPRQTPQASRGAGRCLWGVALSPGGSQVGFRDRREPDPSGPNHRGQGPWKVFDLDKRKWARPEKFQPVAPIATASGWRVVPSSDPQIWNVTAPDGRSFPLPLDPIREGLPRCYTFLKPTAGKPLRLAVGHYWGLSLYEFR